MDSLPADQDVRTVIERELWLLQPQVRAAPGEVAALLHPRFCEFGASGRRWVQTDMITAPAAEQGSAGERPDRPPPSPAVPPPARRGAGEPAPSRNPRFPPPPRAPHPDHVYASGSSREKEDAHG